MSGSQPDTRPEGPDTQGLYSNTQGRGSEASRSDLDSMAFEWDT